MQKITQHVRYDVVKFVSIGDKMSSCVLDRQQFPQYAVAYTIQKTIAVVQVATDESM